MPSFLADITALRRYPAFRRLWFGMTVTGMGSQLTVLALAYQAFSMTHSTAVVGLIGVVALGPTLVGSLGGGSIADAVDRRLLLMLTQVLLALSSAALAVNALLPEPQLWVLFVAAAATAVFQGFDWPTRLAILPMIVSAEDLRGAYSIQSVVGNVAVVVGPALGGVLIAVIGLSAVYLIDVVSYGATFVAAALLPSLPPVGGGTSPSLRSVTEGLRYLRTQRLLAASFVLDLNAMVFGMPKAVFPALGTGLFKGGAATVGLLFAAPGAGSLIASLVSGWTIYIRSLGRALVVCMLIWGATITAFGFIPVLWIGLTLLAVAGGADIIGGIFRVSILQRSTPGHLQGRLSGVFFAAAVSGNRLGDGESGLAAAIGGPQFAVWSGGLACILGTLLLAWRIPSLRQKEPVETQTDAEEQPSSHTEAQPSSDPEAQPS
jgi:predicted MFS family arabinose efflux permease